MLGKGIRQTMFRQSKGYPTVCRGCQGEIERIHPLPWALEGFLPGGPIGNFSKEGQKW